MMAQSDYDGGESREPERRNLKERRGGGRRMWEACGVEKKREKKSDSL
jgi:hypothetical protein